MLPLSVRQGDHVAVAAATAALRRGGGGRSIGVLLVVESSVVRDVLVQSQAMVLLGLLLGMLRALRRGEERDAQHEPSKQVV